MTGVTGGGGWEGRRGGESFANSSGGGGRRKSVKGWEGGVTVREYMSEPVVYERLYGRRSNPKTHKTTTKETWEERELKECTFEPKINRGKRELKGRKVGSERAGSNHSELPDM